MFCAFLGHTGERLQDHWSSGLGNKDNHKIWTEFEFGRRAAKLAALEQIEKFP